MKRGRTREMERMVMKEGDEEDEIKGWREKERTVMEEGDEGDEIKG